MSEEHKSTVEEAEEKTGFTGKSVNKAVIDESDSIDGEVKFPKLFVDKDEDIEVDVDIVFSKPTGKIAAIYSKEAEVDLSKFKTLSVASHKFVFSRPDYGQITDHRENAMRFVPEAGRMLVDPVALRNSFLVWHLKDWDLKDENGEDVEILVNSGGGLEEESIEIVNSIHPKLVDVVMTIFENKIK